MRKILFLLLCASCPSSTGAADFSAAARGTTGAQFLELPAGARAIAMGSAYTSVSGDPFSAYYNPAGLASMDRINAGLMHAVYFQDISYEYGVAAFPLKKTGVLGLSVQYLSVSKIAEMDKTGAATGGSLSPSDMAISALYAKRLGPADLGVAVKSIKSQLRDSASAFAFDLGLQTRINKYAFGLSASNIGGGLKFRDKENSLPATFRAGASLLLSPEWLVSADCVAPKGAGPLLAAGAEYKFISNEKMTMSVRAGYNSRYLSSRLGGISGINAGAGVNFADTSIDYAWSAYGDLGSTHRFSVNLKLGELPGTEERDASLYGYDKLGPEVETEQDAPALEPEPAEEQPQDAARPAQTMTKPYKDCMKSAEGYSADGDYKNAAREYDKALKALPENDKRRVSTYERQGRTVLKFRNIQKAKEFFLAAIQTAKKLNIPEEKVINSYLGLAYCFEKSGNIDPAVKNYKKAMELSNSTKIKSRIQEILRKLEQHPSK